MTVISPNSEYALGLALQSFPDAHTVIAAVESFAVDAADSGGIGNEGTKNTAITTNGAGTLTAAALVGGIITRSGSAAAFSDTTDTALNIVAALAAEVDGMSWTVFVKNTTNFAETVLGGVGVTVSGNAIVPPLSVGQFLLTVTNATTVTLVGIGDYPLTTRPQPTNTAITTAGDGSLTAAALVGGVITRTGPSAAYTDTTVIATTVISAMNNAAIGQSWLVYHKNSVAFAGTIAGNTGLTVSGITIVPPLSVGVFLLTYTAAGTMTMVGLGSLRLVNLPGGQFTTIATDTTITAAAGTLSGASHTVYQTTAAGAGGIALTTRTGAQIVGDIPNAQIGTSYILTIVSQGGGTVTLTAPDGSVTITGTATIATKTTRSFVVTLTSLTAVTFQSFAKGTIE